MIPVRRFAALSGALLAVLLVACGGQSMESTSPSDRSVDPTVAASTSADATARDAYSTAICPIFTGILELDPRLAAMREAGAAGGDISQHGAEIDALGGKLLLLLEELEALPEWSEGANLRHQLITALHGIRAQLLHIGGDPAAAGAADDLANLAFIASDAMDLAMAQAQRGGLTCEPPS